MKRYLILFLSTFPLALLLYGQDVDFSYAESFGSKKLNHQEYSFSLLNDRWFDNNKSFIYDYRDEGISNYYFVDIKRRKKEIITDEHFWVNLSSFVNKDISSDEKIYLAPISGSNYTVSFSLEGKDILYNIKTRKFSDYNKPKDNYSGAGFRVGKTPWRKYSPDSCTYIYGCQDNLYIQEREKDEDTATQLTFDGEYFYSYVMNSTRNYERDKKRAPSTYWVDDGKKILVLREDKRSVGMMTVVDNLHKKIPKDDTYKFATPGDKHVSQYELFLIDVETKEVEKIDIAKYPDQKFIFNGKYVLSMLARPKEGARYIYFLRFSRKADRVDLCRLDAKTGEFKELITEESRPHINVHLFACHVLEEGKNILWWSERTGYGQYYLYDFDGNLKNRVTHRDFVAGEVFEIDTLNHSFIYEAYGETKGENPYHRKYYKINFDGSKDVALTPDNGYHTISLSPDKKYLLDTYSRIDLPSTQSLRDINGKEVLELEQPSQLKTLFNMGYRHPIPLCLKAADGETDLYGAMYIPFNMDTLKRYPIITNVYPGPVEDLIPKYFEFDPGGDQLLAQLGFIVVNVGYRGSSPYRGRDFHCFGYGNIRDYPLADNKYVIEQLARKYSFIDIEKVGIFGHSGGGLMAAAAILTYPDFYKVAVSASGNHDNNIYTQYWGELYNGIELDSTIVNDTIQYKFKTNIPTNMELAPNLRGKLLLITGDKDSNVHPAHTFRLADALIKAYKRFDMMVLPGKDHNVEDPNGYYQNLIRYYFIENLKGEKQSHIDIINHK